MSGTEHIRKFTDLLRIGDRLIERMAEVVRAQNRKIRIVGFELLVGMSVYYSQIVIVVFLAYKTPRILAESTNLVFVRVRITYKL